MHPIAIERRPRHWPSSPDARAHVAPTRPPVRPVATLTGREAEVLALMAAGRSNGAIAGELALSAGAIEKHVGSIFTKLGLLPSPDDHRRVLAVLAYLGS